MSAAIDVVCEFVDAFIHAWPEGDAARLASFFCEDAVYQNGPLQRITGREAIRGARCDFMAMGGEVSVDMLHVVAEGAVVLTERIDYFTAGGKTTSLPVMGTFEIRDGLIAEWRDYFDLQQFTSQLGAGA